MKTRHHLLLLTGLALTHAATAQDIVKAINNSALNLAGSWVGGSVPGVGNAAVWNSTIPASEAAAGKLFARLNAVSVP